MNYQTELMCSILTNEKAKKIIDYVSPIYGDSYVGLWLFEIIGKALDEVYKTATNLRYETNPATVEMLIDYWEDSFGIPRNYSLTLEQRRARLISWRERGPCNPYRLASAVSSSLNGVEVDIYENVAKNTFLVNIREVVYDWTPAIETIERKKPAHLIYEIRVALQMIGNTNIKVAVGLTHSEQFEVHIADIVIPIPISEIDFILEKILNAENLEDKDIHFVVAEERPLTIPEIDALWDEVFLA